MNLDTYVAVAANISGRRAFVTSAILAANPIVKRANNASLTGGVGTKYNVIIGPMMNIAATMMVAMLTHWATLLSSKRPIRGPPSCRGTFYIPY